MELRISIKAVFAGLFMSIMGTMAIAWVLTAALMLKASQDEEFTGGDLRTQFMASPSYRLSLRAVEVVFLVVGGWVAAHIAGKDQLRNSGAVGVGMLLFSGGLLALSLSAEAQGQIPPRSRLQEVAVVAAAIPLACAGGYLRRRRVDG